MKKLFRESIFIILLILMVSSQLLPGGFSVAALGQWKQFSTMLDVAVESPYAYCVLYEGGLIVANISNPGTPVLIKKIENTFAELQVDGNYAFSSNGRFGLEFFDLADADSPRSLGSYKPEGLVAYGHLALADGKLFVRDYQKGISIFSVSFFPELSASASQLNFTAISPGNSAEPQGFSVSNPGAGTMNWTVSHSAAWLVCTPAQGTDSGTVTVSIDSTGLTPGNYTDIITVYADGANGSPHAIAVTFALLDQQNLSPPFGEFATPGNGSTVSSSIAVTGWALDDTGIESVKIYREAGKELVYIGDAILVAGARPDVQAAYPGYPGNEKAGWGYMLLTNFLPGGGNGTLVLHAVAHDKEGRQTTLGTKTIICDNANAVKPFGAIDTPTQGGITSGYTYMNWGWTLTPSPKRITNGYSIIVYVDGVNYGNPEYGFYREDIATLFPGYANSDAAVGLFYLFTKDFENGVHTIQWVVKDDAGENDGIGSRYFTIRNDNTDTVSSRERHVVISKCRPALEPVQVKLGFASNAPLRKIQPDDEGNLYVEMEALGRMEIRLEPGSRNYSPLLTGSHLDPETGVFTFAPGIAFLGLHRMVFMDVENRKRTVTISITTQSAR